MTEYSFLSLTAYCRYLKSGENAAAETISGSVGVRCRNFAKYAAPMFIINYILETSSSDVCECKFDAFYEK